MGMEIKFILLYLVVLSLIFRQAMVHYLLLFIYKLKNRDTTILKMVRQIELGNEDNAEILLKEYTEKKVEEIASSNT